MRDHARSLWLQREAADEQLRRATRGTDTYVLASRAFDVADRAWRLAANGLDDGQRMEVCRG